MHGEHDDWTEQDYTRRFAEKHDLDIENIEEQWDVVEEEIQELERAWAGLWNEGNDDWESVEGTQALDAWAEEAADVVFTLFLAAEMLDVDLHEVYAEKAQYNLKKTPSKDENGKVIDDA